MRARAVPLLLLALALSATAAMAQSQNDSSPPPDGAAGGRMRGFGRGTPPDPVVLKGPPAPADFVRLVDLPEDKAGHYTQLYDRFMTDTKPERDSLAALRRSATSGADRESFRRLRDAFRPLRQDLERKQAAFDDTLHDLLDKDQWKRYQKWREEERKVAEQQRRDQWRQHRDTRSGGEPG